MRRQDAVPDGRPQGGLPYPPIEPSAVLRQLPDPVVVVDQAGCLRWANRAAEVWSGWALEELAGRCVVDLVHPDDLATAMASLDSVQTKPLGSTIEARFRDCAGVYHRMEVRGRGALGVVGVSGIVLALRDLTDRRRWEVGQGELAAQRAVLDSAPAIIAILDSDGRIRSASRALTTLLGHPLDRSIGRRLGELCEPAAAALVDHELHAAATGSGARSFEAAFLASDGRPVPLWVSVTNLLADQAVGGLVAAAVGISSLVEARDRLLHMATHDPLTGLPNRILLWDRLSHALAVARRRGSAVSVVYCDVDGFKGVNDRHGHLAADAVLVELAERIRQAVRDGDTVARLAGDEFVVVVEDQPAVARALAARIAGALSQPFRVRGQDEQISVSTGVASASGYEDPDCLLSRADASMYALKRGRSPRGPR